MSILNKKKSILKDNFLYRKLNFWLTVWASKYTSAFLRIPENMGNQIKISSNAYMTKQAITGMIQVIDIGKAMPISMASNIIRAVRQKECEAFVDFTWKNKIYSPDIFKSTVKSKVDMWKLSLESENVSKAFKEESAINLFTYDQLSKGKRLYSTIFVIKISAKTAEELERTKTVIKNYLANNGCYFDDIRIGILGIMQYTCLISSKSSQLLKLHPMITSTQSLAEMLPNTSAYAKKEGTFVGLNNENNQPILVNFDEVTDARNIMIVGPSGSGKTVVMLNMVASALENGARAVCQDIKGNEYTNIVKGVGGIILDLTKNSRSYINTWAMRKEYVNEQDYLTYFQGNQALSLNLLLSLVRPSKEDERKVKNILTKFITSLYAKIGVEPTNVNSWINSHELNPKVIFHHLREFLSNNIEDLELSLEILKSLDPYLSEGGIYSYLFEDEIDLAGITKYPAISFSYGLLANSTLSESDKLIFAIKFLFATSIKDYYILHNFKKGLRTVNILEEAQIVSQDIMEVYKQDWTLRRAQRVDNFLLANSILSLNERGMLNIFLENATGIFTSALQAEAKDILLSRFSSTYLTKLMDSMVRNSKNFKKSFLFIDRTGQTANLRPIIKVHLDKGRDHPMFSPDGKVDGHKITT